MLFDHTVPSLEFMPEDLSVESTSTNLTYVIFSPVMQIPRNLCQFYCKTISMRRPSYKSEKMEDIASVVAAGAADGQLFNLKLSPVKLEPNYFKPPCPPTEERSTSPSLAGAEASQDKENSAGGFHNKTLEDSGYLTLQNSHIEDHKEDGYCNVVAVARQGKLSSQKSSPTKCQRRTSARRLAASPTEGTQSVSSTSSTCVSSTLPLLKFHEAVCEELAKGFRKNKR